MKRRNSKFTKQMTAGTVVLAAAAAHAQYTPPPPLAPFPGFINEALRKNNPYMSAWNYGGSLRLRYEIHEGYGIAGSPGSIDFRENNADVSNDYCFRVSASMEATPTNGGVRSLRGVAAWSIAMIVGLSTLPQRRRHPIRFLKKVVAPNLTPSTCTRLTLPG
jgi:hypothetical protein